MFYSRWFWYWFRRNENQNINEAEPEPEKESVIDIMKDFKDTETFNDRYLLKIEKQDKVCVLLI